MWRVEMTSPDGSDGGDMDLGHTLLVLLGSFGYAVLGAIVPVFNTEVYAVTVPTESHVDPLFVALALALGQTAGKIPYWLAGRGAERWSRLRDRVTRPSRRRRPRHVPQVLRRLGAWLRREGEAIAAWGRKGPWRMVVVTFVSALTGVPPFIVWPVAVGALDPRWWRFAVPAVLGRTLLFWGIAVVPELISSLH